MGHAEESYERYAIAANQSTSHLRPARNLKKVIGGSKLRDRIPCFTDRVRRAFAP
jgi:hypothetical protein